LDKDQQRNKPNKVDYESEGRYKKSCFELREFCLERSKRQRKRRKKERNHENNKRNLMKRIRSIEQRILIENNKG
jgi:hypothetical protein